MDFLPVLKMQRATDFILSFTARALTPRSSKEELLTPGKVYEFELSLGNVAANFRKGNRLRVSIAGQSFPEFDRNAQSGKEIFSDTELFPAKCTIYHDAEKPATLYLPEI